MKQTSKQDSIPGITLEEETKTLAKIIRIADDNLNNTRQSVQNLASELHQLQEVYDVSDKEGLAQWFNTDARFKQVRQDLLRSERTRKKPYFGRIDFVDMDQQKQECYYIGRAVIAKDAAKPLVIDWRAPIASVYYEKTLGNCTYSVKGEGVFAINLLRKRTYEIENDKLKDFYDSDVVANDELLTKYLARNKKAVLGEIIATIQQEQNEIIRMKPQHNVIVQGSAGSGKTTVAMHRISYILYNYDLEFQPKDFYIIGSNRILLNYITGILPDLDVYGVMQMTMEQLFIRLLYEDWDEKKYSIRSLDKGDKKAAIKGSFSWFQDLEKFCFQYEWSNIKRADIYAEKTHHLLMKKETIEALINQYKELSLPDKLEKLTEHLIAQVENEIYGRNYSYPPAEQKALLKYYQTYFGRKEWNGSIFKLYEDFLEQQRSQGKDVRAVKNVLDLYDLAALAYLYKRIKETEVIQEASHVVIDEAQDFGMMVYGCLKYCLTKCTYTIMGDVSQNIYFDYGLTDWEELRSLMLPGEFDYFGLLRKSYRNTVEISNFATNILKHGSFPIYPVEPIIRHGNEVKICKCDSFKQMTGQAADIIKEWQKKGYETIAIICRDEEEAKRAEEALKDQLAVRKFNLETEEFGNGVMVLPIEYAKGLEFDAVLLLNANEENYPATDGYAKLLYVAATRALHELTVLYNGKLTSFIATQAKENEKHNAVVCKPRKKIVISNEDTRTKQEIEKERAYEGQKEMVLREHIGPKRIVIPKTSANTLHSTTHVKTTIGRKVDCYETIGKMYGGKKDKKINEIKEKVNSEFGTMPDNTSLKPMGHPNINQSIKWMTSNENCVEITSAYGMLRIAPVSEETVRITFGKGPFERLSDVPGEIAGNGRVIFKCLEKRERIEIHLKKLRIYVDKKSGAVSFYTEKEKLLLTENSKLPRQLGDIPKNQTWTYFDFSRQETLKAKGLEENAWTDLNNTAKYISCGVNAGKAACLMSNRGYQILLPAESLVMCCTIPMYGPYLYTEGKKQIDYFFRNAL